MRRLEAGPHACMALDLAERDPTGRLFSRFLSLSRTVLFVSELPGKGDGCLVVLSY